MKQILLFMSSDGPWSGVSGTGDTDVAGKATHTTGNSIVQHTVTLVDIFLGGIDKFGEEMFRFIIAIIVIIRVLVRVVI